MAVLGNIEEFSVSIEPVNATGPFAVLWSLSPSSLNEISNPSSTSTYVEWKSLGTFTLSVTISGRCGTEKSYQRDIIVLEEDENCFPILISNPSC